MGHELAQSGLTNGDRQAVERIAELMKTGPATSAPGRTELADSPTAG